MILEMIRRVTVFMMLAPMSVFLGLLGVGAFWWTLRTANTTIPRGTRRGSCWTTTTSGRRFNLR